MGSRERSDPRRQGAYWDALSDDYARITRIDTGDFHYGPQIPGESALHLLPPLGPGSRALELGCGGGQNSVWLARRGVACTALDISERQLDHARLVAAHAGAEVDFRRAALEDFDSVLPPRARYDLVHSSHALEFADSPARIVRAMAARAKRGGMVLVSTVHPVYNGEWIDGTFEDENGETCGEAGPGMFLENYFEPPDDVRDDECGHVVSRAWPVSAWFRWFVEAGLRVVALEEPPAVPDAPYTSDDWAAHGGELDRIPSTLVIAGVKR